MKLHKSRYRICQFIICHQYLALSLELKQHLKKKHAHTEKKKEREKSKGERGGRKREKIEEKRAKAIKCASQISCYQEHTN